MEKLRNIITPLHRKTVRDYIGRMTDEKVDCMKIARNYDWEFWDGNRRFGYGGYKYDGRWEPVAQELIEIYNLTANSKILDVGCGKGFLLYEIHKFLPEAEISGFDVSQYALNNAKPEIMSSLFEHKAQASYPFEHGYFDLVISLTTLHNLPVYDLKSALMEIERVGKNAYITVEGYRNDHELFNLQCWALTCESFYRPEEWTWLFKEFGYTGDYEFIYFE